MRPLAHGQLVDEHGDVVEPRRAAEDREGARVLAALGHNLAAEAPVVGREVRRAHVLRGAVRERADVVVDVVADGVDHAPEHADQGARRVVGHGRRPARADAVGAVAEREGQDGHVVRRLDGLAVVLEVVEHEVVVRVEDLARDGLELREDVSRARGVLAAHDARAELARGRQQVDVVRAHEVLRHADDRAREAHLAVVVGRVLGHVARQLRHLDLLLELALEAGEEHLALRRLQPVDDGRDRPLVVRDGEEDELLVHEVAVGHGVDGVVHEGPRLEVAQPGLAVLDALLREGHVDEVALARGLVERRVVELVRVELAEVLLGLLGRRRAQPLVVLDRVAVEAAARLLPRLVLGEREEDLRGLRLRRGRRLDDGRDEAAQEARDLEQRRPEVVEAVDQQALDVGPVVVLVRHDHEVAVAERLQVRLVVGHAEPQS